MNEEEPQWPEDMQGDEPTEAQEPELELPGLLPEEFWKKREAFQQIRQAAYARRCSADVVFWATMARLSGMVSHRIRVDSGIGKPASLNLFVAIVGPPGAGKSTSSGLSADLMDAPDDFLDGLPIGTGEGMCEVFMGEVEVETGKYDRSGEPVMTKMRAQVNHNAYFYVDEGGALTQNGQRSSSVLNETIRSAAIGGTIGQTNASADRKRLIKGDSYSMGMVVGYQPVTALPLLADADTGTPQRFFWSWVLDPNIPKKRPPYPGKLVNHLGSWRPDFDVILEIPERIQNLLDEDLQARRSGKVVVDTLDGHAGLMKVKACALLAILDNRKTITEEDWELAEMLWEASCLVRNSLVARARREADAARKAEEDAAVNLAVRTHEAKSNVDHNLERIARRVQKLTAKGGVGGVTWGALRRELESKDRPLLEQGIGLAVSRGWVVEDGDRICIAIED